MSNTSGIQAILIERNYKGSHERYALTMEEFKERYGYYLQEGMSMPKDGDFDSYTLAPMVHIGYTLTTVGSSLWNTFFTDMSYGLTEGDIEEGNLAYIRESLFMSLKRYIKSFEIPHVILIRKLVVGERHVGYRLDVRTPKGKRLIAFDVELGLLSEIIPQMNVGYIQNGKDVIGVNMDGKFVSRDEKNVVEVSKSSITEAIKRYNREVRR